MDFLNKRFRIGKCCIKDCKSFELDPDLISYFSFPKVPSRCAVWMDNVQLCHLNNVDIVTLNKKYRLCSLHFEGRMFSNEQNNRLKPDAIPTLFEVVAEEHNDKNYVFDDNDNENDCSPSCSTPGMHLVSDASSIRSILSDSSSITIETCSSECQSPSSLSHRTPRKNALRKKLNEEIKKRRELQSVIDSHRQMVDTYSIETALSIQFIWAFKKMLYLNYFQHSPGANCINDFDRILCSVEPSSSKSLILEEPNKELFLFKGILVGTVDYRHLDLPEINTFTYMCGYLMKKCLEKHTCDICIEYARYQKQLDKSFLLSFIIAYSTNNHSTFGNLMMPDDDSYNFIFELENIFINNFPFIAYEEGVGAKLKIVFVMYRMIIPVNILKNHI